MVISKLLLYITTLYYNILSLFEGKRDMKILMIGLDAAGKTSLLYRLKFGENIKVIPTIGYNVETVDYKNLHMDVMDICGQSRLRSLWSHYYEPSEDSAIIFVVDSCDRERMVDVKEELTDLCEHEKLKNSQLLIFANKQDKEGALTSREVTDILDLYSIQNRKWFVQPCSATTGNGIFEGFDWISSSIGDVDSEVFK
ncbi:ADP-ribosylation factor-related [Dictyostelium discoideum AX4]|uniref:ADP-ribosylation factor-related n=1 Tax=Dictyostelium discoideum TaxID=44689 RepID=Q54VB0_DICDI|nr:ADP-ribosylation factor-related [Dictyostelium discoideum AX4]EAL67218.1 ADP-ribosylation factor-related [Dictyostelium discoideum AX4]|eukprot:XP_641199.1 ADP-ribosylation factor-related [Dictyostelium discoideum AX4]